MAGGGAPIAPVSGAGGNDVTPVAGGGALAGMGGGAGTDGSAVAGSGGAGGDPSDARPPCLANENEAVIIGDSYINWSTHTLPADLVAESGQTWRLYAIGGASMASGGIATLVPDQFEQAYAEDPNIKLVLMDGGGNDIMIPDATWVGGAECKNRMDSATVQVCRDIIDFALEKAEMGMQRMADVGVKDILYFFYPEVPEGTLLGGLYPNAMLEYGSPLAKQLCEAAETRTQGKLRCHFVDMKPVFAGHNPDWFFPTDIHPNELGSAAMADAIWQRMQDECIGQPASSGCCAP
jgi:lysophospholipase L1-like esterase